MHGIGNTPFIKLNARIDSGCADIYVKFEGANLTGSMKDRMALSMIEGGKVLEKYCGKVLDTHHLQKNYLVVKDEKGKRWVSSILIYSQRAPIAQRIMANGLEGRMSANVSSVLEDGLHLGP